MSVNGWSVAEDAGEGTLVLVWFPGSWSSPPPPPPACVRKAPLGLFCRLLEDSTSWQVVPSIAPHRTEELNPTPEALESVPLARLKWEYCYRLEFPLEERKERPLVLSSLPCWDSNADLTWPACPTTEEGWRLGKLRFRELGGGPHFISSYHFPPFNLIFSLSFSFSHTCLNIQNPRFPGGSIIKESACNAGDLGFHLWVGKVPWRRAWQPTPVFLPGEPPGQRSRACCGPQGRKESDTTALLTQHKYALSLARARYFFVYLFTFLFLPESWVPSTGFL